MSPRHLLKLIIYLILAIAAITLLIWWQIFNAAVGRDLIRLAQMRELQATWLRYYSRFNTFVVPGCASGQKINICLGEGERRLAAGKFIDPKNFGQYIYQVAEMGEDNFQIDFFLERGAADLLAGQYYLDKEGIKAK